MAKASLEGRDPHNRTLASDLWAGLQSRRELPAAPSLNLVLQEVECFNRAVNAIIDTGAGISVISPKFCRSLNLEREKWKGPTIELADGLRTYPDGATEIVVGIFGHTIKVTAVVLKIMVSISYWGTMPCVS